MLGIDAVVVVLLLGLGLGSRTSVGRRAINLLRQKVDRLFDRAEDPVEALDLAYNKQLEALQQVKRGVAQVVVSERRLAIQASDLRTSQEKLRTEARLAVGQGRDDLARLALTRAESAKEQISVLEQQVEQLQEQENRLQSTSQRLQLRVASFRSQRDQLRAQYTAAQASVRIGETVTGLSEEMTDVHRMLDRAQDRTAEMQARAEAIEQLVASGQIAELGSAAGDDIDRQLAAASRDTSVDAELIRLRRDLPAAEAPERRLGDGEPSPESPSEGG